MDGLIKYSINTCLIVPLAVFLFDRAVAAAPVVFFDLDVSAYLLVHSVGILMHHHHHWNALHTRLGCHAPLVGPLAVTAASKESCSFSLPYFCLNGERATLKNKTCIGAASLKKKKTEFPLTCMHSASSVGRKGNFVF